MEWQKCFYYRCEDLGNCLCKEWIYKGGLENNANEGPTSSNSLKISHYKMKISKIFRSMGFGKLLWNIQMLLNSSKPPCLDHQRSIRKNFYLTCYLSTTNDASSSLFLQMQPLNTPFPPSFVSTLVQWKKQTN